MQIRFATSAVALLFSVPFAAPMLAQGRTDYMNVETPQVKPITVARIAGHDYVLACNTPDNSVSIFTTDESVPVGSRMLRRVPVGLEPCSVIWNPLTNCFYTADFLSDSVTRVLLEAPTGPASLNARVIATTNILPEPPTTLGSVDTTGVDEPMDIALVAGGSHLVVTSNTGSSITFLNALSLSPELPPGALPSLATTVTLLIDAQGQPTRATKEPRRLLVSGTEVFAVAFKGGRTLPQSFIQAQIEPHDLDILAIDYSSGSRRAIAGLGTTNAGAVITSAGDLMLVGGFAHIDLVGGSNVANAETGFVDHRLWCLRPGPGGQVGTGTTLARDLNDDPAMPGLNKVDAALALAGLRDIVAYESSGSSTKLFVTAMHSDRIAVLTDNAGPIDTWPMARIDLTPSTAPVGDMRGPRGLAFKTADGTTAARVYVLNRLSNTMHVIDADNHTAIAEMSLGTNPQPAFITDGRPFLYSARLSQNGFNSCASCHMDGRTDSLSWELGAPVGSGNVSYVDPVGVSFVDSIFGWTLKMVRSLLLGGFDHDKKKMVTQTLQGLLNYAVDPESRSFVTNGRYHWRGDRIDLFSFNEAFVGLMKRLDGNMNNTGGTFTPPLDRPNLPMGIAETEMAKFVEFMESIHYPPNPRQQFRRRLSGDLGPVGHENNINEGTGALAGLKAFHVVPTINGRSCVHCHALPEGSNNKLTFPDDGRPLESAAFRGLLQRERRFSSADGNQSGIVTGIFGLLASGTDNEINTFVARFDGPFMVPESSQQPNLPGTPPFDLRFIRQFIQEVDWGVGPAIGQTETVVGTATSTQLTRIGEFETYANEANCGLAVRFQAWSGATSAYTYDPTSQLYVPEATGGAASPLSALLTLLATTRDRLVFQCTPLGSERRVAHPLGTPMSLPASPISQSAFLPMRTNTSYAPIPLFTKNWQAGDTFEDFTWDHAELPTPASAMTLRLLQHAQIVDAGGIYGANEKRHDAPRRFRVAAQGLQPGARLILRVAPTTKPISQPSWVGVTTKTLTVPLYPTSATLSPTSIPIWESAVELDMLEYLLMMAGGPFAPGVANALNAPHAMGESPPPGTFNPSSWNRVWVELENPDGTSLSLGWQPIRIE